MRSSLSGRGACCRHLAFVFVILAIWLQASWAVAQTPAADDATTTTQPLIGDLRQYVPHSFDELIYRRYGGSTLPMWALAFGVFVLCCCALVYLRNWIVTRLNRFGERSRQGHYWKLAAELVGDTSVVLLALLALVITAHSVLATSPAVLEKLVIVGFLLQTGLWGVSAINFWVDRTRQLFITHDPSRVTVITATGFLLKLVLCTVVLLVGLQNLGVEITALLASVGVAGIAIGLALQNVLGDLFASLSIVLDKPFVLGDFIIVDDKLGVVENIGLKTTRIRSLSGEQIVFSNADLLSSRIHNYKKMQERRVAFQFRVPYDTSLEQLRMIPAMVREIILNVPSEQMETWRRMCLQHKRDPEGATLTRFDRAHFSTIGDSALHFEIVYYVYSADYNLYMDVQQYINLEILRRFSENGIRLALPARTVHVERHAPQTPVPTTPPAEA